MEAEMDAQWKTLVEAENCRSLRDDKGGVVTHPG